MKVTTTQGSNNVSTGNNRPTVTLSDGTVLRVSAPTSTPEVLDFGTVSGITTLTIAGTSASGMNLISVELDGKLLADTYNVTDKTVTRLRFKTDWNWMYVSQIKINGSALTTGTLDNSGNVWSSVNAWKNGSTGSGNETYSQSARGDWFDVTLASSIANFSELQIFMYLDSSAGSTTNIFEIELFFSDGTSYTKVYPTQADAPNQTPYQFNSRQWQNFGALGDTVPLVPSIATTVRARPDAGFSIASYSGADSPAVNSIAHGLTQAPTVWITKARSATSPQGWVVNTNLRGPVEYQFINAVGGSQQSIANQGYPWSTQPTAHVITLGANDGNTCDAGVTFVNYAFKEVEGFSKFGFFDATSNPFIYLGFTPAFLMTRNTPGGVWVIRDIKRDGSNPNTNYLSASGMSGDNTGGGHLDFLSNGFKINGTAFGSVDYFYMAFAKNPFASNARAR